MYGSRFDRDLAVISRDRFFRPIDFNAHQASLHTEVFRLELVEMQKRALRSVRAVD